MKVAIVGSRDFPDPDAVRDAIRRHVRELLEHDIDLTVVSGGARGVDTWAEDAADEIGVPTLILKPDWADIDASGAVVKRRADGTWYNALAGHWRNQKIVDVSDEVHAFWDGRSSGTRDTLQRAHTARRVIRIAYM
jgi:uncharacterized phage-like protein YoqJ